MFRGGLFVQAIGVGSNHIAKEVPVTLTKAKEDTLLPSYWIWPNYRRLRVLKFSGQHARAETKQP
jgi:hypothetical protein